MIIRLDKYLADSGLGTRSGVRSLIRSGSVLVNGKIEKDSGRKLDSEKDEVSYDGKTVGFSQFEYYMLNKPAGVITASRDKKEKTVIDLIESEHRRDLFPVGRLDRDTEGLLLITNDGKLSHELLAPGKHVDKVYIAFISGELPENAPKLFEEGIDIGDEKLTKPARLTVLGPEKTLTRVEVILTEGRYHEVKRMFEAVGCHVEYLKRISMGNLILDDSLKPGEARPLTEEEIACLKNR